VVALGLAAPVVLAAAPARADEPRADEPRVGVVGGVRINIEEDEAESITGAVGRVLEHELAIDAVAGAEARERLGDFAAPRSCAAEAGCLRDLAGRMGVDQVLFLVIVRVGDQVRLESRWLDRDSGEVARSPVITFDRTSAEERDEALAAAAQELLPGAARRAEAAPGDAAGGGASGGAAAPDEPPGTAAPIGVVARVDAPGRGKRIAGVAVSGAGVALAAASVYLALRARSQAGELSDRFAGGGQWDAAAADLERAHYRNRNLSIGLGVAAGAAVATGATLYLLGSRERRAQSARLFAAPAAGRGVELVARWSF